MMDGDTAVSVTIMRMEQKNRRAEMKRKNKKKDYHNSRYPGGGFQRDRNMVFPEPEGKGNGSSGSLRARKCKQGIYLRDSSGTGTLLKMIRQMQ